MTKAKETKFTEEELKQLQEIKQSYDTTTVTIGQLELEQVLLTNSKNKALADFATLREAEAKLANDLTTKYGKGKLNLETGIFTTEE